jgi:hypothetical protein
MKRRLSLSVSEFQKMLDALQAQAAADLLATRARMEALQSAEQPPG